MSSSSLMAWIARGVERAIVEDARRWAPLETGGVLLGYWTDGHSAVVVKDAIHAGPEAVHRDLMFLPDTDYQEREIARRYELSGRVHTYLGDWHAHPGGGSSLSRLDLRTLRTIANSPEARASFPLMVVAYGGDPWRLSAWRWSPRRIGHSVLWSRALPVPVQFFEDF